MLKHPATNIMRTADLAAVAFLISCHSQPEIITITGAGSSFVNPIMARWIADFQQTHTNVHINYQPISSGGGIQQLKKKLIDFGATDAPLSDEQLKEMQPLVQVAESGGPVCITYNLPELKEPLKLSPAAIAGIYLASSRNGVIRQSPRRIPVLPCLTRTLLLRTAPRAAAQPIFSPTIWPQ
jgi:phosphate transport system substrate-binding protein